MANSKCYVSFINKMSHFNADLEYIDILYNNIKDNPYNSDESELFPGSSNEKYNTISKYKVVQKNRMMVVTHLRATLYTAYIKDLYEEFTIYLKGILKLIYSNSKITPERLTGEHRISLSSVEILKYQKNNTLVDVVIDNIFQALENERSTISLITKMHSKIGIEKNEELITNAIYYLEIRHKLVHTDGIADEDFKKSHQTLQYTSGNRIKLSYTSVNLARIAIFDLVSDIDQKVMELNLVKPHTMPID